MRLNQDDVIKSGLTRGCPGCLDINSGRGGMRGSATHNEDCRTRVEAYLRRTNNKRIAEYDSQITERLERYRKAVIEKRVRRKREMSSLLQSKRNERKSANNCLRIRLWSKYARRHATC